MLSINEFLIIVLVYIWVQHHCLLEFSERSWMHNSFHVFEHLLRLILHSDICVVNFVNLTCQAKINSLGLIREEYSFIEGLHLSFGYFLQCFNHHLLLVESETGSRNMAPHSIGDFKQGLILLRELGVHSVSLNFEVLITHFLELSSHVLKKFILSFDQVFTTSLIRLYNELTTNHISYVRLSRVDNIT